VTTFLNDRDAELKAVVNRLENLVPVDKSKKPVPAATIEEEGT
jgi:hypothetical protein